MKSGRATTRCSALRAPSALWSPPALGAFFFPGRTARRSADHTAGIIWRLDGKSVGYVLIVVIGAATTNRTRSPRDLPCDHNAESLTLGLLAGPPAIAAFVNENLMTSAPAGYHVAFRNKTDEGLITEWVPAGETAENWTEMVTVQVFYHLGMSPEAFMTTWRPDG